LTLTDAQFVSVQSGGAQSSATGFRLYLIRHAESENNARPVYQRVCDPAITRRGQLQAEYLADWMQTLALDVLITSPFLRTLQTTQAILAKRQRLVEVWHDIFEVGGCCNGYDEASFTGAAGLGCTDIQRFFSREHDAVGATSQSTATTEAIDTVLIDPEICETGWWNCRDREQSDAVAIRAARVADRLIHKYADSGANIALVIHADFKRELLRVLLQGILCLDAVTPITNAGVSILSWHAARAWQLHTLNSITHLPVRLQ
jgi:2,3-bisphosphoglycerate-dependent phosphoglycerate mutase